MHLTFRKIKWRNLELNSVIWILTQKPWKKITHWLNGRGRGKVETNEGGLSRIVEQIETIRLRFKECKQLK